MAAGEDLLTAEEEDPGGESRGMAAKKAAKEAEKRKEGTGIRECKTKKAGIATEHDLCKCPL